jgi:hypothetical protein
LEKRAKRRGQEATAGRGFGVPAENPLDFLVTGRLTRRAQAANRPPNKYIVLAEEF